MSSKRKNDDSAEMTGREKKKQKTAIARTIAVQSGDSTGTSTPGQGANQVAGPSRSVQFDTMKGLPGSLDVERFAEARAFEINAMHDAMKNARASATHRAWQQLPRHLRRRAASHDVRRVPLRLREKAKAEMDPMRRKALGRSLPKRGKAKRLTRTEEFLRRQQDKSWLETHIWHAKRMKMENMWGYRLAVQPTEKAFRPSHRASVHGSILHDASYFGIIELKGPAHILSAVLDSCCDPQGPSAGAKRFLSGARACDTHIYKYQSYPFDLIAPVTVLWQPSPVNATAATQTQAQTAEASSTSRSKRKQQRGNGKGKGKEPEKATPVEESRQVWIRVHPSVFEEVFVTLQKAASFTLEAFKKASADGTKVEMEIADLRGHTNIFEIMGPKSSQIIKGALQPALQGNTEDFRKFWNSLSNLQTTASLPRNIVIGFRVNDPRLSFPPKNPKVQLDEANLPSLSPTATIFPSAVLAQSEIWDEKIRRGIEKPKFKKKDIDARRSKNLVPGTKLQALRQDDRIPVILIQRFLESTPSITPSSSSAQHTSSASPGLHGWTLIIPSGWAMPFFSSLTHTGTRVGGQRERQTQSFEAGCAYFPRDYPRTEAYDEYADDRAFEEKARWERKPPAKRPNFEKVGTRSPWQPDWEVVLGLQDPASSTLVEDADMITTQRDTGAATGEKRVRPWLLRGVEVQSIVNAAANMFNHGAGLLEEMNRLRAKRKLDPLDASIRAEELWKGALVRVKVRMCGRGRPEDLAVIYSMDDEEVQKCTKAEAARKNSSAALLDEDENQSAEGIPPQDSIIGYVTTGNYSLSLGQGYAIGAIPVARLLELRHQAERLRVGAAPLVKIRDRHEMLCRAARLEIHE